MPFQDSSQQRMRDALLQMFLDATAREQDIQRINSPLAQNPSEVFGQPFFDRDPEEVAWDRDWETASNEYSFR